MEELKNINETLKNIERKLEDKNKKEFDLFGGLNVFSWTKTREEARKEREEKRNEELLKIQKTQSEHFRIQTGSIKSQEKFNRIIALTGVIIALTTFYSFIIEGFGLENSKSIYWIISILF